jgi:hypothetical protein
MTLRIVDADTREIIRELGIELSNHIKGFFAAHVDMSEDHAEEALLIWDEMKEYGHRLACDCRPGINPAPLLVAALPDQIRRMPKTTNEEHGEKCVFLNRSGRSDPRIEPNRSPLAENNLTTHVPFADPDRERNNTKGRRDGAGGRVHGIARVLFTLLEKSFVNWIFHGERHDSRKCANKINRVADKLVMCSDRHNKIMAGEMLVTATEYGPGVKEITELRKKIANFDDNNWPKGSRPHGYMCAMINSVEKNSEEGRFELSLENWEKKQFLEVRPHVFAEGIRCIRAPYIGVISYALPNRTSDVTYGMRCYMQPCLDEDSWFPVDSDYERHTVEAIIKWRSEFQDGWTIDIKKPLFDEMVEDDDGELRPCRPDFVLRVQRHKQLVRDVAVETMGFDTVEYEERKKRTHPLMRRRWDLLVEHDMIVRSERARDLATSKFVQNLEAAALHGMQC